jgi:hypothetical protein
MSREVSFVFSIKNQNFAKLGSHSGLATCGDRVVRTHQHKVFVPFSRISLFNESDPDVIARYLLNGVG